ncbi:MAG: hypothetical protein ABSF98_04600 [Bryobacteraceae bacterium]|jgi:hypothetical protein
MDSATKQMLETVDKRLAKLQQVRALILEEFGESSNGASRKIARKPQVAPAPSVVRKTQRKIQLHEWLKSNGPSTRAEIIAGTRFPEGTIGGYLSTEKDLFENRDGKWHAR